jgi:hypothetical protein
MEGEPNNENNAYLVAQELARISKGSVNKEGYILVVDYGGYEIFVQRDSENRVDVSIQIKGKEISETDYVFPVNTSVGDIVNEIMDLIHGGKTPVHGIRTSSK